VWHAPRVELELRRSDGDRRRYLLDGVGSIRLGGLLGRSAVAEADGRRWTLGRRGFWRTTVYADDATGVEVGRFEPRSIRRGGTLSWDGRELLLSPSSAWRSRYALTEGEIELATFEGKGWGRRPVAVTLHGEGVQDPGLLLFAAFVVRGLAEDDGSSAAVVSSTAAAS
jgi:hypothetical protein